MEETTQKRFYTGEQTREIDQRAIAAGNSGLELMQRAGRGAYRCLRTCFPRARRIAVLCGSGNNGGDGYIVAAEALRDRLDVELLSVSNPATDTAQQAAAIWRNVGGEAAEFTGELAGDYDVIIDALLGTGLARPVEGRYRDAIAAMNRHAAPVMALDIPSGLNADTGMILGAAVQAEQTITFIARKTGLYTGAGRRVCGQVLYDDLDVATSLYDDLTPDAREASLAQCQNGLPRRRADAHKGSHGSLLVLGGGPSMSGAALLAGWTAAATGTGLVRIATHPDSVPAIASARPELLVSRITTLVELKVLIQASNAMLVGPGLGQTDWAQGVFEVAMEHGQVSVIDADGLNLLAQDPFRREDWVLTPHPGEAARLLQCTTREVQQDRISAAKALASRFGGVCILKGSGTVVTTEDEIPWLCTAGDAALATAGTGDVLSGLIAGLVAQGMDPLPAAIAAVTLHAHAGEQLAMTGRAGVLAAELIPVLHRLRNDIHD